MRGIISTVRRRRQLDCLLSGQDCRAGTCPRSSPRLHLYWADNIDRELGISLPRHRLCCPKPLQLFLPPMSFCVRRAPRVRGSSLVLADRHLQSARSCNNLTFSSTFRRYAPRLEPRGRGTHGFLNSTAPRKCAEKTCLPSLARVGSSPRSSPVRFQLVRASWVCA